MPIRAEKRHHYGRQWRTEIRPGIIQRATTPGGVVQCECVGQCGTPHGGGRCIEINGRSPRTYTGEGTRRRARAGNREHRVVITVAHVDQDPANNDPGNLLALCEQCHNRLDGVHRARHARATRYHKATDAAREGGQLELGFGPRSD